MDSRLADTLARRITMLRSVSRSGAAFLGVALLALPGCGRDGTETYYCVANSIQGTAVVPLDEARNGAVSPVKARVFPAAQRVVLDRGIWVEDLTECVAPPCQRECEVFDATAWMCRRDAPGGYSQALTWMVRNGDLTMIEELSDGKTNTTVYGSGLLAWARWRLRGGRC